MSSAFRAAAIDFASRRRKPMSRKELMVVSSQKMKRRTRSPASARPTIEPMNRDM